MRNKKGFTLIEVMVVMAIIAVLAVLIIGAITLARNTSRETTNRSNAKTVQTALEGVYAKYRMYCGGSTGVTCGAQSLETLRAAAGAAAFPDRTCSTVANIDGGGRVTALTGSSYTIRVATYACTDATYLPNDDLVVN
jgi:prepilin-type N-terminal cleavage/methylation domain-containing protein